MRFLARILSFLALLVAVVVAAVDAIRFVATSVVDLSTVSAVFAWVSGDSSRPIVLNDAGRALFADLFAKPAIAILLILSLGFWVIGYRRPQSLKPFDA